MKIHSLYLVILAASALLLGSCITDGANPPSPNDERLSNLPHSRPESWQGSAAFGSFMPQSQ